MSVYLDLKPGIWHVSRDCFLSQEIPKFPESEHSLELRRCGFCGEGVLDDLVSRGALSAEGRSDSDLYTNNAILRRQISAISLGRVLFDNYPIPHDSQ